MGLRFCFGLFCKSMPREGSKVYLLVRHLRGAAYIDGPRHAGLADFNPRATCVARRPTIRCPAAPAAFQFTRHLRGAAPRACFYGNYGDISIHAPLAWRGTAGDVGALPSKDFNPRATCVARPSAAVAEIFSVTISIHAPLAWRGPQKTTN